MSQERWFPSPSFCSRWSPHRVAGPLRRGVVAIWLLSWGCDGPAKDSETTDSTPEEECGGWLDLTEGAPYQDVATGFGNYCGIRADGTLECYGFPEGTVPDGVFTKVSIGTEACALDVDGYATCWDTDEPIALNYAVPEVPLVDVVAADLFSCGADAEGKVYCWGYASSPFEGTHKAMCGESNSSVCDLSSEGSISCVGASTYGTENTDALNAAVEGVSGTYEGLACSVGSVCAAGSDDLWTCWGQEFTDGMFPPEDEVISDLKSSGGSYCGLVEGGSVACWGALMEGGLPCGTFTDISVAGGLFGCGIRTDGTITCWGRPT